MAKAEVIDDELLDALSEDFFWQEYSDKRPPTQNQNVAYAIVARVQGLPIIWADEHPPPHFHVSYQGEDASYSILDCARLSGVRGLERYESRVYGWWAGNRSALIEKWNSSRPSDCPVGKIELPRSN